MGYFKSKKGSLEDEVNKLSKFATESGYQKMFKKELEKAGKGLGAMSDQEKKDFFNNLPSFSRMIFVFSLIALISAFIE